MSKKRNRWDSSSSEEEEEEEENDNNDETFHNGISSKHQQQQQQQQHSNRQTATTALSRGNDDNSSTKNDTTTTTTSAAEGGSVVVAALHNPLLEGCRSVYECYERLERLDEGTYGIVWKAKDNATNEIVALKQIKFESELMKEGFPIPAVREISVLLALSHECIVTVREMVVGDAFDKVFMVMEYMEMDLQRALQKSQSSQQPFPQSEIKSMLHQILSGVHHIHDKWYFHRDLKTSNILVHRTGRIAICDFGLARKYHDPLRRYTQMVITLWYRPPELLFGEGCYGTEVDMWSVGCIFGELLQKSPLFNGQGELDQIDQIFTMMGTPTTTSWPNFTNLPNASLFKWKNKSTDCTKLREHFAVNSFGSSGKAFLDEVGFDLLRGMLILNPKERISASQALQHEYFKSGVKMQKPRFQFDD